MVSDAASRRGSAAWSHGWPPWRIGRSVDCASRRGRALRRRWIDGGGEIRTYGAREARRVFRSRCNRPLCHPSVVPTRTPARSGPTWSYPGRQPGLCRLPPAAGRFLDSTIIEPSHIQMLAIGEWALHGAAPAGPAAMTREAFVSREGGAHHAAVDALGVPQRWARHTISSTIACRMVAPNGASRILRKSLSLRFDNTIDRMRMLRIPCCRPARSPGRM